MVTLPFSSLILIFCLSPAEILVHRLGRALGDRPLQLLQRCLPDGLHAFEVLEQLGPALFPHPGYFVQNGAFYVSRLELPVVFDGEAVGLLLDAAR